MERGAGNEVQLTDGMARLIGEQPFHGLRYEGRRFDCGDKFGFLEAQIAFALKRPDLTEAVHAFLKKYLCLNRYFQRSNRLSMTFSDDFDPTVLREYDIRGIVGRHPSRGRRLRDRPRLRHACGAGRRANAWRSAMTGGCPRRSWKRRWSTA